MKKTKVACIMLWLFGISVPHFAKPSAPTTPTILLDETCFIQIARDMELFNGWLIEQSYSKETAASLRHQGHQHILTLYEVDPQSFKESVTYYLASSIERTLQMYEKIYAALEELLPPS